MSHEIKGANMSNATAQRNGDAYGNAKRLRVDAGILEKPRIGRVSSRQ
jgi:hypothetical protein